MADQQSQEEALKGNVIYSLRKWGESSVPPTLLATLTAAQHLRPFQPLPMLFPPVFLFSSWMNINGFKIDAAGVSAAWSGLYMLMAMRRKQSFKSKFGVRGLVRGATLGLCAVQVVGGGLAYTFGRRKEEDATRATK
ncbi:uncharacterized protein PV09_03908 [Verruconis gallopava]|uniref:Uncharacterized protein n=1 Tax=Verruconis gallopava TaxID=253628 RepID=A0A0D2AEG7_9PEZI|nr:uncharacterized protein PV09_03908 [Verruconis gallopava]KIW05393.1 hypothetical protein PV09_03908 [Verruconis gallopava]